MKQPLKLAAKAKPIPLRLSEDLAAPLRIAAHEDDRSIQSLIRKIIREFLEKEKKITPLPKKRF